VLAAVLFRRRSRTPMAAGGAHGAPAEPVVVG
jgi:hypothetical protein